MSKHDLVSEIKSRVLLSSIIGKDVKIILKGNSIKSLCPFHPEKTPSFTIDNEKKFYYCFGCGAKGDIFSYLIEKHGMNFQQALESLAMQAGININRNNFSESGHEHNLFKLMDQATFWFVKNLESNYGKQAKQYLNDRGITKDSIAKFKIGYCEPSLDLYKNLKDFGFSDDLIKESGIFLDNKDKKNLNRFNGRIIFPIIDEKNKIMGFGGRIFNSAGKYAKYINSPETILFKKKYTVYGINFIKHSIENDLFIVEGYTDVISLDQKGIKAVAPLGTAFTIEQLKKIWLYHSKPTICFDGDTAGFNALNRTLKLVISNLSSKTTLSFLMLPKGDDPDSLLRSNNQKYFLDKTYQKAIIDLIWQQSLELVGFQTPEQKINLKQEIIKSIESIPDLPLRKMYEKDLMSKYYNNVFYTDKKVKNKLTEHNILKTSNLQKDLCRQKILLASICNHHYILDMVAEDLMKVNFTDQLCEEIRQSIMEIYSKHTSDWYSYFSKEMFANIANIVDDETLYKISPFAHSSVRDKDLVLKGFMEIFFQLFNKKELLEDKKQSVRNLKESFDKSAWLKLKNLKINQNNENT